MRPISDEDAPTRKPAREEWRACGQDEGSTPDCGTWHTSRDDAIDDRHTIGEHSVPPYDDIWLERRTVSAPERMA